MGWAVLLIGVSDLQEMKVVERQLGCTNWGFVVLLFYLLHAALLHCRMSLGACHQRFSFEMKRGNGAEFPALQVTCDYVSEASAIDLRGTSFMSQRYSKECLNLLDSLHTVTFAVLFSQ